MPSRLTVLFIFLLPRPPTSTLFPYTTLFRSSSPMASNNVVGSIGARLVAGFVLVAAAGMSSAHAPGLSGGTAQDRKSTRLNSSHGYISYAVFCLKKKRPAPLPPDSRGLVLVA